MQRKVRATIFQIDVSYSALAGLPRMTKLQLHNGDKKVSMNQDTVKNIRPILRKFLEIWLSSVNALKEAQQTVQSLNIILQ
jgi:hypothetical protein